MTKTYAQIQKQIEALSREAESLKRKEVAGVISRIKEAITAYGLTAADLGLGPAGASAKRGRKPGRKAGATRGRARAAGAVKYRDDNGNVWGGRGPRPKWLRDALSAGKQLSDFAV